jgi:RNA polymerase sigma-70 factor (ECF subfamily)
MRPASFVRRMRLQSSVSSEVGSAAAAVPVAAVAPQPAERIGSYASFEDFYEAQHVRLFRALGLVTGNRQETEDVLQEAFLRIWNRWDTVRTVDNPTGYLYRTAVNISLSRRRRLAVAARSLGSRLFANDPMETVDARDEIGRALVQLTPRERAAIVLTDMLDFPAKDAAAAMGIRDSTVRVLASRARARMRAVIGERDE